MFKRIATFLFGVALVSLGILFFIAPERSYLVQILVRYWPVFLILAGIVRLGGFLLDRQPRSPLGGLLLSTVGGILLSANLRGESQILLIFGRYWFFLLLAVVAGRVLKQYGHRPEDGPQRPRAFSPGAIVFMVLIVGGGLASHRLASDGRALGNLRLPVGLSNVREMFGVRASVEDRIEQSFTLAPQGRLLFSNLPANLEVRAGGNVSRAVLIRKAQGGTEEEARAALPKIHLQLAPQGRDLTIGVSSDDPNLEFSATLVVELPAGAAAGVEAGEIQGNLTIAGLRGDQIVRDAGQVTITDNTGAATIENPRGGVRLSEITGAVRLTNARRETLISGIRGPVALDLSGGTATLERIGGAIRAAARSTRIELRDIQYGASGAGIELKELSDCRLTLASITAPVVIEAKRTPIEAGDLTGDLQIQSSSERVRISRVTGNVRVVVENGSVEAVDLHGVSEIEATREVTARNVRGSLVTTTRLGAITLEFDESPQAEVQAVSQHGAIRVTMPESASFGLDAETSFGRLRVRGFEQLGSRRAPRSTSIHYRPETEAPLLNLRSTNGDITLTASDRRAPTRAAR